MDLYFNKYSGLFQLLFIFFFSKVNLTEPMNQGFFFLPSFLFWAFCIVVNSHVSEKLFIILKPLGG